MVRFILSSVTLLVFLSSSTDGAAAFVPTTFGVLNNQQKTSVLYALSPEEAAARAGGAAASASALLDGPPPLKLFEDDLLDDMQQVLLKLERRVKDGPGALSLLEVEELHFATQRIIEEMKQNEHDRPKPTPITEEEVVVASKPSVAQTIATEQPKAKVIDKATTAEPKGSSPPTTKVKISKVVSSSPTPTKITQDTTNNEEGDPFDGEGGLGLAKGTTNTYIIPGMDEMSPEEYRTALQQSVIDRQKRRVESGVTGNRSSWDYLNSLTGESGVLKDSEYE